MTETLASRDLLIPSKLIEAFRLHSLKNKEEQKETIVQIIQAQKTVPSSPVKVIQVETIEQ
jgi:hypothetical protein